MKTGRLRARRLSVMALALACSTACKQSGDSPTDSAQMSLEEGSGSSLASSWSPGYYLYAVRQAATTGTQTGLAMVHYEMDAELLLDVRWKTADARELALSLRNVRFRGVGSDAEPKYRAMGKELEEPFLFTLTGGRITAERHVKGLGAFAVGIQRSLASALQFTVDPGAGGGPWRGSEVDASGEYSVEYAKGEKAGSWVRRKLAYEATQVAPSPGSNPGPGLTLSPTVPEARCTLIFEKGALARLASRERIELPLGKGMTYGGKIELTLDLKSRAPKSSLPWAEALAKSVPIQPGRSHVAPGQVDALDGVRSEGHTYETALAALEATAGDREALTDLVGSVQGAPAPDDAARKERVRERSREFTVMVALLRSTAGALEQAEASILERSPAAPLLLDALASVGSPEAQAVMVKVLRQRGLPIETRARAAAGLMQVDMPSPEAVASLTELVQDTKLSVHALYGLGTMSRKLRLAGEEARALAIAKTLITVLQKAAGATERAHALRGIANSGHDSAFEAVQPSLRAESVKERTAAVDAIRLMSGPAVDALLVQVLASETANVIRSAAVEAIEVREPSKRLSDALSRAAQSDKDSSVRLRAVNVLVRWLPQRPELRPVLEALAKADDNPRVREVAMVGSTQPASPSRRGESQPR